jgi:hypothetical protein
VEPGRHRRWYFLQYITFYIFFDILTVSWYQYVEVQSIFT